MDKIIIHSPGLLTTVQDEGRYGYQRFGMPVSGAMDIFSLRIANLLAGNPAGSACLEATLTGPGITFDTSCTVAITGADMQPALNGEPVRNWESILCEKGDFLNFGAIRSGCRSYIAFSGGIDVPVVMGSRSTFLRAKTGGYQGRSLQAGDVLSLGQYNGKTILPAEKIRLHDRFIPRYVTDPVIHVIPGPEVDRISFEGIRAFLLSGYTVTPQCDRMGYRLAGPPVHMKTETPDIISAGISYGTIQVTGEGQLIILMADRQTTGGYIRMANIAMVDIPAVAQLKPGDTLHFREISVKSAQKLLSERWNAAFDSLILE
jgi:antagonist of KipI